ncbi:MAG: hypothetical protein VKJ64_20110, partial [Leptolyngbyaceae bacterium]|nr:hypothetical protein [Leptolyngbyaceae bacterium]
PSPRAGEGLSTQEPGLKSLLPFWEKGFREEGQSFVSQSEANVYRKSGRTSSWGIFRKDNR